MSNLLTAQHISHQYGKTPVIHDCSLHLHDAERIALIGPSGCGKSTLLRIIAGLEDGHSGTLLYGGQDMTRTPAHQRKIGLMFQDHALFPHMSVTQNIAYGITHLARAAQQARIAELLTLIRLTHLAERYPEQLSGGERQRVALARSLAPSPRLLLLDEPFASLDRSVRDHLLAELPTLLAGEQVATIYVTHDFNEACQMANRIVVMHAGRIVRDTHPATLYQQPQTHFIAQLLGIRHRIPFTRIDGGIRTAFGDIPVTSDIATGALIIPPETGIIAGAGAYWPITGIVQHHYYRAPWVRVTLRAVAGDAQFEYDMPQADVPSLGSTITMQIRLDQMRVVEHD